MISWDIGLEHEVVIAIYQCDELIIYVSRETIYGWLLHALHTYHCTKRPYISWNTPANSKMSLRTPPYGCPYEIFIVRILGSRRDSTSKVCKLHISEAYALNFCAVVHENIVLFDICHDIVRLESAQKLRWSYIDRYAQIRLDVAHLMLVGLV